MGSRLLCVGGATARVGEQGFLGRLTHGILLVVEGASDAEERVRTVECSATDPLYTGSCIAVSLSPDEMLIANSPTPICSFGRTSPLCCIHRNDAVQSYPDGLIVRQSSSASRQA